MLGSFGEAFERCFGDFGKPLDCCFCNRSIVEGPRGRVSDCFYTCLRYFLTSMFDVAEMNFEDM